MIPYGAVSFHRCQLNWFCNNDGAMNNRPTVTGWIPEAADYIRSYASSRADEVGASQRQRLRK
jgi:hypothetical protein